MVASSQRKLRIFISHSHHDNQFGIRLYEDLNNVIRKGHDTVWYDGKGLKIGDHWRKVIDQQLERCNVFILLFSRAAKKSGWVDYELDAAINRTVGGRGKIFVICCDDSPPPKNLKIRYQLIACTSPEEYKPTINKIACDLGLDTEPEDLKEATIQQWTRQLQFAFDNKDWIDVNRRADFFIERFPDASLFSIYRMKSFALLELEQAKQSLDALDKASSCAKDREQHLKLLEEYTVLLIDKEYWHGVRMASDRALKLLPDDIKWLTRQEQAHMKLGLKKQVILPLMNGTTTTVEFSEVEEDTSIDAPADTLAQTTASTFANSDNRAITSDFQTTQSRSTTSLLDNFTQQMVPHRHLKQMFQYKLSLLAFLLNIIVMPIISSAFVHQMLPAISVDVALYAIAFLLLFLFIVGWLTRQDWFALTLSMLFGILWGLDGHYVGSCIVSWFHLFNWIPDISIYIPYVPAISLACIGWYWHHDLFRGNK